MAKGLKEINKDGVKTSGYRISIPISFMTTFVFTLVVLILMFTMFAINNRVVNGLRKDMSSFFISNLTAFKEVQDTKDYAELTKNLNYALGDSHLVKYVIVTDINNREIYSTFFPKKPYEFIQMQHSSVFRLKEDPSLGFRFDKIENIEIKRNNKIYYIGIYKSDAISAFVEKMQSMSLWTILAALFIALFFALFVSKAITKPLLEIEEIVSKIGRGDLSNRLEYTRYNEINRLVQAYNMMANALQRLYSSLEAQVNDRTKKLKDAYSELKSTQAMMVHSEKMKSLGELVAGIMHEINNPINFIYGNMTHLSNYSNDLIEMIDKYTTIEDKLSEEEKKSIQDFKNEIDYEFLKTDMPDLIKSCKEGADRAKNIIQDLKSFSRTGEAAITDVDIVSEMDTTLNILHNKIKHKVEIHKEYVDIVPKIEAFGGQLNQVFMNILDNAIGAIKDSGDIWIRIKTDENFKKLIIEVEDNGEGMDSEVISKVFDPFFTTKPVGQGTGLGMSITHKIVKNHQGDIKVDSVKGKGTKFTVTLPINLDREQMKDNLV